MSDFSFALSVTACFLSILAVICVAVIAVRGRALRDELLRFPVSRLRSIEQSLTDTQDALTEVANRVKMMKVRNAANHSDPEKRGLPDPYKDPDGWRKAMNSRLSAARLGAGKLE
jgi:hypothetical protein